MIPPSVRRCGSPPRATDPPAGVPGAHRAPLGGPGVAREKPPSILNALLAWRSAAREGRSDHIQTVNLDLSSSVRDAERDLAPIHSARGPDPDAPARARGLYASLEHHRDAPSLNGARQTGWMVRGPRGRLGRAHRVRRSTAGRPVTIVAKRRPDSTIGRPRGRAPHIGANLAPGSTSRQ